MNATPNDNDSSDVPSGIPLALRPLGPQVARDDPYGQSDDFESFKRKANDKYPGADIRNVDPEAVRRWIKDIRCMLKHKGNG